MNLEALPFAVLETIRCLASVYDARTAPRFVLLVLGVIFAKGKRTVASWLRAARVGPAWRNFYAFLYTIGQRNRTPALLLAYRAIRATVPGSRVLMAIDDTPTKRFGPKVEGAGRHHNPTPGPADSPYLYGHIWVTLSLIAQHPLWGAIGLPLWALLYVRQKQVERLPSWYYWNFQTKLELAAKQIAWAAAIVKSLEKTLWIVCDGFYAKRPVLKAAAKHQVTIVSRLRKDAGLRDLPPALAPGQKKPPGGPRKYGLNRLSLITKASDLEGWQTEQVFVYGEWVWKTSKTFLATWPPAGGVIRVVIVKEEHGWIPLFCTDPKASVAEIVQAAGDRFAIEQNYHDLKEVEGTGQQQVRNLWTNIGSFVLTLWAHTLVELWAWDRPRKELCDRSASPWDDASRRPSHQDRVRAFQRAYFQTEYSRLPRVWQRQRRIRRLFETLLDQAL
jgi:hypothetical protein